MKPTTIDEYIAAKPEAVRSRLQNIRDCIHDRLAESTEAIKWGSPAILHPDGMILVMFAAYQHHVNVVVTPSAKNALGDVFSGYETGKGSLKVRHDQQLPTKLIAALVDERLREYLEEGATWM